MHFWLVKTEPTTYSIDTLRKDRTVSWDGVRNYQARNFIRQMKPHDRVIVYHSSCETPGAVGLAAVVSAPFADATAHDRGDPHYDPRSTPEKPVWSSVTLAYTAHFPKLVSLSQMRTNSRLAGMQLLKQGNRLSVLPLTPIEFEALCQLGSYTN
jgi:predicted RNA-binding protein with PUA-like domain